MQFRRAANRADRRGASCFVDSLINFEVKHFNHENPSRSTFSEPPIVNSNKTSTWKPSSSSVKTTRPSPDAQPPNLPVRDIRFENVNFAYSPSRLIFSDLYFTFPAGKRTAIVGPSGCGKSTILRLFFMFLRPFLKEDLLRGPKRRAGATREPAARHWRFSTDTPSFYADVVHNVQYRILKGGRAMQWRRRGRRMCMKGDIEFAGGVSDEGFGARADD